MTGDSVSDPAPTPEDYAAAREFLRRIGRLDTTSPEKLEKAILVCATDRARKGGHWWDLLHGLRSPKNPMEMADAEHYAAGITAENRLLVYAGHPPEIEDVLQFFAAWRARLGEYGNVLSYIWYGIAENAGEFQGGAFGAPPLETRLATARIEQIYQYLAAYKNRDNPVQWGRYEAASWHRLAEMVCHDVWRQWASLDQYELDEYEMVMGDTSDLVDDFPTVEALWARLELEQAEALQALRESLQTRAVMPPPPLIPEDAPRGEPGSPSSSPPVSAAVANGGGTQEPEAPPLPDLPEAFEDLEAQTPHLDSDDKQTWVLAAVAARLDDLELATLNSYRQGRFGGMANSEKTFGRDRNGRIWRKESSNKKTVYYLRKTLLYRQGGGADAE